MAYKLVTVLDDAEPIDNVLPALSMDVDEVFYLYHDDMPLKTCDAIEIVIGRYKPRMRVHFRCLKNDREEIGEILKQKPSEYACQNNTESFEYDLSCKIFNIECYK